MNKLTRRIALLAATLLISVIAATSFADQHQSDKDGQETLAEMWVMVPKDGKMDELAEALREHVKFRRSKQDPRKWEVYTPVLGQNLNRLGVRASGFTWKDMDSYRDWSISNGINQHFNETAGQYVDHYQRYLSVEDRENSHWGPEVSYNYVGVTHYTPKAARRSAMKQDIKMMADAAKAKKWPYHWDFTYEVGGRGGLTLAVAYENWAAMAPPKDTFAAMLTEHMGDEEEAGELLERWAGHFERIDYNIWALRSDLME